MSIRSLRRWWQLKTGKLDTPLDGEVPFLLVSFAFHLVLLILLAIIVMPGRQKKQVQLVLDTENKAVEFVELPPEIEFAEEPIEDIGSESEDAFEIAESEAPVLDHLNEDPVDIDMPDRELGEIMSDDDMEQATAENLSRVGVKGDVGVAVKGASGAVDKMTQEILLSLDQRKTLVVWMFDKSASLMRQRGEITDRFDKIYKELGMLEASGDNSFARHEDNPLLTAVYAFGQNLDEMTSKPTNDLQQIKESIRKIQVDRSGIENVFSSIIEVASKFKSYRRINPATGDKKRNVMIIVVSDEAGDDGARLDECVRVCTKAETPIFVIGVPAPFGRRATLVKWVDPDPAYDQSPQWASVSQGPESILPERIRLDYAVNFDDLDMIDSGFGPFNLTRLCYETGGVYYTVHPNRRTGRRVRRFETKAYAAHLQYFFDHKIMKRYKPDYVSRETYMKRLQNNKARSSLVQAAEFTSTGVLNPPNYVFPKLDEAQFVRQVTLAQQFAAFVEPKIEQLYQILKVGEGDRSEEMVERWQAGYDLAMGRVLAAKLRASAYNRMLAMAKTKLKFKDPDNNTWVLKPADSISTGSADEKLFDKAKMYLNRVVDEHPGTPWAMLAQRELQTPIGYEWGERFTPPPRPRNRMANNNNPQRPRRNPQPQRNAAPPKQRRAPPKL